MKLHNKSSELLLLICKKYNETGKTEFFSTDIDLYADEMFFNELETNSYIARKRDVVDTIVVLERTIDFAKTIK